jgi:enterochelin esterase family protein
MQEVDWADLRQSERRSSTFRPDPLNPHRFPEEPGLPDIYVTSILALPKAPPQIWSMPQQGAPSGELAREVFRSKMLGNARLIQVYTPPGYQPKGEPYDLLIFFGGHSYTVEIPTPVILDNLLAAKRIRPAVAVFVANPGLDARNVELSCHLPFVDFLVQELLPWVHGKYNVTNDPRRTTAVGFSLGGLTAAYAAIQKPEVFGNVISQSGSFFWKPADDPEFEWLTRQIAAGPRTPARFYVEAGSLENGPKTGGPSLLIANRHLRDVLTARGYEVMYREYSGDHQSVNWRGTLADGLQFFLRPVP